MPGDPTSGRPWRARPVPEAPVELLVADAGELAKDWLLALVEAAPLADAPSLPVAALAERAPAVVEGAAQALRDDAELPDQDLVWLGDSPAAVAAAVEALRGVLHRAALAGLRRPSPELTAALADRLAAVSARMTTGALEALASDPVRSRPPISSSSAREPTQGDVGAHTVPPAMDGLVHAFSTRAPVVDGDPLSHLAVRVAEREEDGRSLAILLVEFDGLERLLASQSGSEVADALREAESAVEDLLRPGDAIHRETLGRLWVTLPGTGPAGARALALRAAAAVERAAHHRGAPLTASVGVAVYPNDGEDAEKLFEVADDGLFAARAAGTGGAAPPAY